MSLFVLLDALSNVLLLLLELEFFAVVLDDISHGIHDGLDALASLHVLMLALTLLFKRDSHVFFDLFGISSLDFLELLDLLLLLGHVVLNDFHSSLALTHLLSDLVALLLFDLSGQLGNPVLLLILAAQLIVNLLLLRLFKHYITHAFLLDDLSLQLHLLLAFDLHFLTGLTQNLLVEVLPFLKVLLAELSSQFDLLVKNFTDVLLALVVFFLDATLLFLVKTLAKLLNLTPLVVRDIRG